MSHKAKLLPRKLVICGHEKEVSLSLNSFWLIDQTVIDLFESGWIYSHTFFFIHSSVEKCKMNYKLIDHILKVVDIISGFTPRLKCHSL